MARSGPVAKDTSTVALGLAQVRIGTSAANIATTTEVLTSTNSLGALANTKFIGSVDYWKLESGFPLLEDLSIPLRESAALECAFKEVIPFNLALARGIDPLSAVNATVSVIDSTFTGTHTGDVSVGDTEPDVVQDTWMVVLDGTGYTVYGVDNGDVGGAANVTGPFVATGGEAFFVIPANFFSASNLDETYTFSTTPYVVAAGAYADVHAGIIGLGSMTAPAYMRMEAVYTYPSGAYEMVIVFPRANITSSVEMDFQTEDNVNIPLTIEAKNSSSDATGGNAVWDSMGLGVIHFQSV